MASRAHDNHIVLHVGSPSLIGRLIERVQMMNLHAVRGPLTVSFRKV
jgi:hypothetical protein